MPDPAAAGAIVPPGWRVATLDGAAIASREALLDACATALEFPGWYGRNWDALADCLRDLGWLPADGYLLLWRHAGLLARADPGAYATAVRILRSAAAERAAAQLPPLVALPLDAH